MAAKTDTMAPKTVTVTADALDLRMLYTMRILQQPRRLHRMQALPVLWVVGPLISQHHFGVLLHRLVRTNPLRIRLSK